MLEASPNRHSRHCLRSALHHLERADALIDIDTAMAAFRALTAEEEAATSLMLCLKERGYRNADRLKPKDHVQKNAISPFLDVLGLSFSKSIGAYLGQPVLKLEGEGDERRLMIGLPIIGREDEWAFPQPPLNFTVKVDGKPLSYRPEIEHLVATRGRKNIIEYLREQANQRNKLLYAGPHGYPREVTVPPGFFEHRKIRVLALLRAYLLVEPYDEHLSFVQDALDAFLTMVGALNDSDLHEFL
jgi:hypothetical protein